MRRPPFVALFAAAALVLVARSASATTIPLDPLIGIIGLNDGSQSINDGHAAALTATGGVCDPSLPAGYFCVNFSFNTADVADNDGLITAVDLAFWDANGGPIPTTFSGDCDGPCDNFHLDSHSVFRDMFFDEDGFTLHLSVGDGGSAIDVFDGVCDGDICHYDLQVFVAPFDPGTGEAFTGGFTSVQGYNGSANTEVDPAGVPLATVPEPTSLLLLGSGLVGAFARRRRQT